MRKGQNDETFLRIEKEKSQRQRTKKTKHIRNQREPCDTYPGGSGPNQGTREVGREAGEHGAISGYQVEGGQVRLTEISRWEQYTAKLVAKIRRRTQRLGVRKPERKCPMLRSIMNPGTKGSIMPGLKDLAQGARVIHPRRRKFKDNQEPHYY